MGRLLLLIVLAVAVGGSVLTLGTRETLFESSRRQSESQADVLAREIAEAGQSVALREMVRADGFVDPTGNLGDEQDYDGGQFRIAYSDNPGSRQATITVTGTYGGAVHTIESTYELHPMDAPGPLWLDVPYATASITRGAEVSGTVSNHPVHFDQRLHEALELESLLPLGQLETSLGASMASAGSALAVPDAAAWTAEDGLLADLQVTDAEGLYQKALASMDPTTGDVTFEGDQMITGNVTWGQAGDGTRITHVNGDLTVVGSVRGNGALIVSGGLHIEDNGRWASDDARFDWDGLVIVRDTESLLPVQLDGRVRINGMLVVAHQAFAPGGHLDVSVYRDVNGMSQPSGSLSEQVRTWRGTGYPFHQHTHAFDITPTRAPRGDHVRFLANGAAGVHEYETQFEGFLDKLGSEPVYVEFGNAGNHGYSRFNLEVAGDDGTGGLLARTIQNGFGRFARADRPRTSKPFPADQLRRLDVDVVSLRALRQAFDSDAACADGSWPLCVGKAWDRHGALSLRLMRAADEALLYESTLYWHMREDEEATHEAEEAAWREKIENGEEFGTRLTLSRRVDLTFDIDEIKELAEKLDFVGDRVVLVASTSSHQTPAEARAAAASDDGFMYVCHRSGRSQSTLRIEADALGGHLGHGDTAGQCDVEDVVMCTKDGRNQKTVKAADVPNHLAHGCTVGACSVRPDDD